MENHWIIQELDGTRFSSSSDFNARHSACFAKLNSKEGIANWSAKKNSPGQWLQIDLGKDETITAVKVQGRFNQSQWVTKYNLQIGSDLVIWQTIENIEGARDQETPVIYNLPNPIIGRYVRFVPVVWQGHISMRVDICIQQENAIEIPRVLEPAEFFKGKLAGIDLNDKRLRVQYIRKYQIVESENEPYIENNVGNNPEEVEDYIKKYYLDGAFFDGLDSFFTEIVPQNKLIDYLKEKYGPGSALRIKSTDAQGNIYEGGFENNKKSGTGIFKIWKSNTVYFDSLPEKYQNKLTELKGRWSDDKFIEGQIWFHLAEEGFYGNPDRFMVENVKTESKINDMEVTAIYFNNLDSYQGQGRNFQMNGEGILKKEGGEVIIGTWVDNELFSVSEEATKEYQKEQIIDKIYLYDSDNYDAIINTVEENQRIIDDVLKNSYVAKQYLWSLLKTDLEKAFSKLNHLWKSTNDKAQLYDTAGCIYKFKGQKEYNLELLNEALIFFKLYNYNNKEFGEKRISEIEDIINRYSREILLRNLGVKESVIDEIIEKQYKRIWQAECYIAFSLEKIYPGKPRYKGQIEDHKVNCFIPTNSNLTKSSAVAFIRANRFEINDYLNVPFKYQDQADNLDKAKIEIIDITEIIL